MTISKAKTFSNILYTCLTKGVTLVCVFVTSTVVARNLSPAEYGVIGFAMIIICFLSRFSDLGLGSAVIRSPEVNERKLSTAFSLKIILSVGAFLLALAIAPFSHFFFENPATANVIRVLSVNFLISVVGFVSLLTLTREMNYRALVIPGIISSVVRCIMVVFLIYHGWKYWAIVMADVGATLALGIGTHVARPVSLKFRFEWPDAKEYLRFGLPLFGSGVLVFIVFNLDNFLVGAKMGAAKLGYYAIAFNWASLVCSLLGDTVNNVLLPTLSAIQNDVAAMRRWYLKTLDLVAFIAVAANTALLVNVHYFLVTFLGKGTGKWLPATMALQILCFYGILRAVTEPIGPCLMARGETKALWNANLVTGVVELGLLVLVVRTGRLELIASAVLIAYISQAVVYLPVLRRDFSIKLGDILTQLWPMVPAIAAGYLLTSFLPDSLGYSMPTLALRGIFTACVVAVTHGLFTRFRCFHAAGGMISQNLARATG